jgi:hypothetical protein
MTEATITTENIKVITEELIKGYSKDNSHLMKFKKQYSPCSKKDAFQIALNLDDYEVVKKGTKYIVYYNTLF